MRYILRISSGADDFYGRVTAEDGTREWDVEADWTVAQARRWAAAGYPGGGPGRFGSDRDVVAAAAGRFTGRIEIRGWEDQVTGGQPGDELYLSYVAGDGRPASGQHGTVIAGIPEPEPEPAPPEPEPPAVTGTPPAALAGTGSLTAAAAQPGQGGESPGPAAQLEPAPGPGPGEEGGGNAG